MIQKLDCSWFAELYDMMKEAFPQSEYRNEEEQRRLFALPQYEVYGDIRDGHLCAFLAAWDLKSIRFGEHLATRKSMRNNGIGADLFRYYERKSAKPLVFEVELPDNETAARRIGFYERLGYHYYGDIPYFQGSFHHEQSRLPLRLMMNDPCMDRASVEDIIDQIYDYVYHQQRDF